MIINKSTSNSSTIVAALLTILMVVAVSSSASAQRQNIIETGGFENGWGPFETDGSGESIVSAPVRAGGSSGSFLLRKSYQRSEVKATDNIPPINSTRWYGWSLFVPSDFESDGNSGSDIVSQFHQTNTANSPVSQIPTGLRIINGEWVFRLYHQKFPNEPVNNDNKDVAEMRLGSITADRDKWTDWVMQVKWTW